MELSLADKIWNRACEHFDGTVNDRYEADLVQCALLSLHGLTMNGGVFHPFDAAHPKRNGGGTSCLSVLRA